MYYQFQSMDYPFVQIKEVVSFDKNKALKSSFVDFKLNVYSNVAKGVPLAQITKIVGAPTSITFSLAIKDSVSGATLATGDLLFTNAYGDEAFVRYYFNTADFSTVASGYLFEGYFCFNKLNDLINEFKLDTGGVSTSLDLEPATTALFSNHRVDAIRSKNALPLILQTTDKVYVDTDGGNGVSGNVKLIAGNNCSISIEKSINTVIVAAQRNANDSQEELCGVWKEKVFAADNTTKDVLCNEVVYSISGVKPDSNGNVTVKADRPLVCSSLTRAKVAEYNSQFNGILGQFSGIMSFIYIGLPSSADNPSVVNCNIP